MRVRIRFTEDPQAETYFVLKLGPMTDPGPPERGFAGGEEVTVDLIPTIGKPECVDITFDDGQVALEVPREYFDVIQ